MQKNSKGQQIKSHKNARHLAEFLTNLEFADDLAILSNTVKDAKPLLNELEKKEAVNVLLILLVPWIIIQLIE